MSAISLSTLAVDTGDGVPDDGNAHGGSSSSSSSSSDSESDSSSTTSTSSNNGNHIYLNEEDVYDEDFDCASEMVGFVQSKAG